MGYAAEIFGIFYSQWDYEMVNISRILKFLTWHWFDEFGWNDRRQHFSRLSTILLFKSFFKYFTNHRKKTNRVVVFSSTIWNTIRARLTILGVTEILCSFRLVLEGKTGKEITESSRLEFLEKFSGNNFALSDAEDNDSRPLNRGGIAD